MYNRSTIMKIYRFIDDLRGKTYGNVNKHQKHLSKDEKKENLNLYI